MILTSIALVLLTAAAAGVPAIWLIRDQLDRQAWAQVEQGSLAAQALYEAQRNELDHLATLTAQRPTLHELLAQGDLEATQAYLQTLQEGSGLDLVLVCDDAGVAAQAGQALAHNLCAEEAIAGFHLYQDGPSSRAWLFASHPLETGATGAPGTVFVGTALDDGFAVQMRARTGLEHSLHLQGLQAEGQPLATSLTAPPVAACPDLELNREIFDLLNPEEFGITLSETFQIDPEASTCAIIVPHEEANYFNI